MESYTKPREFQVSLRGATTRFISKPGLPAWDQISPSARLLAELTTLAPTDRVLFMGCGHGAAVIPLSRQLSHGEIWLNDPNVIALRCAQLTLEANQVQNATISNSISLLPAQAENFNSVLIDLPKGRQLGRRWLLEAASLLKPGGSLFLAGANDLGIQSLIKDGHELFGNLGILSYKKGSRLAHFVKTKTSSTSLPGWAAEAGIAPGTWSSYSLELDEESFIIYALPGVFSQIQLDQGTRLLLQHVPIPEEPRILDLGCGSGVIGMVLSRRIQRKGQNPNIEMLDSSLLAVASAEKNIQANHITGVKAFASDLIEDMQGRSYDLILSNPPFHTGVDINYAVSEELISQSHTALVPGGELVLVANRFIRYHDLMERSFKQVRCLYQDAYFHVFAATK